MSLVAGRGPLSTDPAGNCNYKGFATDWSVLHSHVTGAMGDRVERLVARQRDGRDGAGSRRLA
jgi:hypothetical protein